MPVPTAMTEVVLAEYLHEQLGQTADALGLSPGGDDDGRGTYRTAIWQTVWAYGGISVPEEATNLPALLALARREAWRLASQRAAGEFDFSSAGTRESRSQLYKQIAAQLATAEAEAAVYDAAGGLVIAAVHRPHDPYASLSDASRVLP